jgi:deoxyribose-phosphate aldolase
MVAAGASRLGTSNSVAIIEELKQQQAAKGNK